MSKAVGSTAHGCEENGGNWASVCYISVLFMQNKNMTLFQSHDETRPIYPEEQCLIKSPIVEKI